MKKFIFLSLILLCGLLLRCYNLNFPSIGYHNMKENEYLNMAQEMLRTQDFITRRISFYNAFDVEPQMKLYPQPPLVSYQIILAWKLLGENLWGARLFNVFFGLASILVMYFLAFLLFNSVNLGLFSTLLLAMMPLAVFFSRNLQPESPAFFFMLLGNFFYLRFASTLKKNNLFWGGLSLSIAWLYKFSFLIGILPVIFCFPYRNIFKEKRQFVQYVLTFFLPYLVIAIAILWLKYIGQWEFQELSRVKLWEVFSLAYWRKYGQMIWWYVKGENFTWVFTLFTLLGVILAFLKMQRLSNRYIIGWTITLIPYGMIFSDYINQHNYYQMPFLILVCVASTLTLLLIAQGVKKLVKKDLTIYLMVTVIAISAPFAYNAIGRMYGTVFLGEDVAGESLREFTAPSERIFLLTYPQGYAIARYAARFTERYVGWPETIQEFQEKERKFNMRYICFYPAEYALSVKGKNPDFYNYIQGNYHVKEVGLLDEPGKVIYLILEKGKGSDPKSFLESFSGPVQLRTIYKIFRHYYFFYTLRPQLE